MYKFKAKLALFMALCVLLCSIFSIKVDASEVVAVGGITAASVFEICLFVGSIALTCYAAGEVIENREEIATFGKNLIDSISLDTVPDGWLFEFMDSETGQDYVIGSEVVDYIQSCVWLGILGAVTSGGGNQEPDQDPDKEPDQEPNINQKNWLKFASPSSQLYASFTALGATWFADSISKLYQKWMNGDELTETEQAVLKPLMEAGVNQNDIAQQWSGESFSYVADFNYTYVISGTHVSVYNHYTGDLSYPVCGRYFYDEIDKRYVLNLYRLFGGELSSVPTTFELTIYQNGVMTQHEIHDNWTVSPDTFGLSSYNPVVSYSANCPIFSSLIDVESYLKGTGAVTDALNYAKTYQNADWLSDDWKGLLIDPLTNIGLSLSQLTDLAKALGVHAVGNNLSAQELADLLKQSLPAVNPELMPDAAPISPIVPNPDLLPIYYPSPTAHPLPGTNPGTNPGNNPDVTPGTDPKAEEIPADDFVPTINDSLGDITGSLKYKFPFSIPWDVRYVFQILADTPKAPRFELPLVIKRFGIDERVIVDMAMFQVLSDLSRSLFSMLFGMYLMNLTFKVVAMRKEE